MKDEWGVEDEDELEEQMAALRKRLGEVQVCHGWDVWHQVAEKDTEVIFDAGPKEFGGADERTRARAREALRRGVCDVYTDGGVQGGGRAGVYGWAVVEWGKRVNGRPTKPRHREYVRPRNVLSFFTFSTICGTERA